MKLYGKRYAFHKVYPLEVDNLFIYFLFLVVGFGFVFSETSGGIEIMFLKVLILFSLHA
jgi:hypothetical protein